jgi:hypothetical protein
MADLRFDPGVQRSSLTFETGSRHITAGVPWGHVMSIGISVQG